MGLEADSKLVMHHIVSLAKVPSNDEIKNRCE